jgi:hypothetical protein
MLNRDDRQERVLEWFAAGGSRGLDGERGKSE